MTIDPQTEEGQLIVDALSSAQAALNPLSGFLRAPRPKVQSYLDTTRDKISTALALFDDHSPPTEGPTP